MNFNKKNNLQRPIYMMSTTAGGSSACYIYDENQAPNDTLVTPDITFSRIVDMNIRVTMDDGNNVTMWGFADNSGGGAAVATFPSAPIRVTQGQIVHTELTVQNAWAHTIHHHGIEPATESDGVGHISFDIQGNTFTYQWRPMHAGTYFYHCHVNTVLHAEMGMYGALIVDPPEGPGTLFENGPTYDVEAFWVVDEIDSAWHTLRWDAGTCGEDVGLNDLNPDYFVITGVDGSGTSAYASATISPTVRVGEKLLARYVCAGYHPQRINFGGLTGTVYMSDGRPLPNAIQATELRAHSAERFDVIFEPTVPGEYIVTTDIIHWVSGEVLGTTHAKITVVA
ncbi:Multicopper oxidase [hydrothermal vent metagenome]|uniref:Multicopper oxidase n=1 Tax=hydrothermal vent metagenome TaxID=652676 RepID=A0A3B0XQQ8_9ZZZZ